MNVRGELYVRGLIALAIVASVSAGSTIIIGCGSSSHGGNPAPAPVTKACTNTPAPQCEQPGPFQIQAGCPFYLTYSPDYNSSTFVYSVASGTVPPGLTFSTLQGSANVGQFQGTVSNSVVVGNSYTVNVAVTGNTSAQSCTVPITFTVVSGACQFPAGTPPVVVPRTLPQNPDCSVGQTAEFIPNLRGGAPGLWAVGTASNNAVTIDPVSGLTSILVGGPLGTTQQINMTALVRDKATGKVGANNTQAYSASADPPVSGGGGGGTANFDGNYTMTCQFSGQLGGGSQGPFTLSFSNGVLTNGSSLGGVTGTVSSTGTMTINFTDGCGIKFPVSGSASSTPGVSFGLTGTNSNDPSCAILNENCTASHQ